MDGGATTVALVRWEVGDHPRTGIPTKQSLERIVCAAITAVYGERADRVQKWVSTLGAHSTTPKTFAWSYMAGWYAEHGCEDFYRQVWRDKGIAAELATLLKACGAWDVAEARAAW